MWRLRPRVGWLVWTPSGRRTVLGDLLSVLFWLTLIVVLIVATVTR